MRIPSTAAASPTLIAFFSAKHFGAGSVLPDDRSRTRTATTSTAAAPIASTCRPTRQSRQYWSATVYDRDTHALIRNMPWPSRSSQTPGLQKNADGSVDIYFGPKAPAGQGIELDPHRPQPQNLKFSPVSTNH